MSCYVRYVEGEERMKRKEAGCRLRRYEDTRAGPHREMVERCGEYGEYGEYGGGGASDDSNHLPVACYLQSLSFNNIYSLYISTTIVDTIFSIYCTAYTATSGTTFKHLNVTSLNPKIYL